jgi:hypothetical protein
VTDSDATLPGTATPAADTSPVGSEDTAQTTPPPAQPTEDWQARYKALQTEFTRKAQALSGAESELAELRSAPAASDEDDDEAPKRGGRESAALVAARDRAEQAEWQIAEMVHWTEAVEAYALQAQMEGTAQTASDRITAFVAAAEKYHQARLGGATPAAAAPSGLPTRAEAVQPRVDQNQSDAPAPSNLDPKRYEGGANGGGRAFFREQLARVFPDRQG